MSDNEALEFKEELNLDNPDDVDWLYKWAQRAQELIKKHYLPVERIREFVQRQRLIGEHEFGDKMVKRHNKRATEFYKQFADAVYYKKDGVEYGLDIQTLWWFRTNEWLYEDQELLDKKIKEYIEIQELVPTNVYQGRCQVDLVEFMTDFVNFLKGNSM